MKHFEVRKCRYSDQCIHKVKIKKIFMYDAQIESFGDGELDCNDGSDEYECKSWCISMATFMAI